MAAYPVRSRARRALKGALAGVTALVLSFAGIALTPQLPGAEAASSVQTLASGPAVAATTTTITALGAFSGTVPAGICTVTATVYGGSGGSAGVAAVTNGNGSGAGITATFPVVPGLAYSGSVGDGGKQPTGNDTASTPGTTAGNGGGVGGVSGTAGSVKHHGAGGGGYSELLLGGTTAVVAGGGGGSGGGHSSTAAGAGGNAGLPTTTGVTAGSAGNNGRDVESATTVGGGKGGTTAAAGAGGTNSASPTSGAGNGTNGFNGSGRNGGNGAADPNPDAGGGGGGGWFGGGGGASTNGYNTQQDSTHTTINDVAGAGGGGGASYIAPSVPLGSGTSTPSGISSVAGAKIASGAGKGAAGSVTLVWNSCSYDLAVSKSVSPTSVVRNASVTWTVAVTNNGPAAMTLGDTVTIADTLPGAGAKTIASIAVSGGTNSAILANGTFTCSAGVGSAMPASLDCYRPYAIGAAVPVAGQYRGLNVGETLTVTYTQPVTEVANTTLTNTATVTDRVTGDTNDSSSASTTVAVPPVANNDSVSGLALGTTANVSVLTNDTGSIQSGSVKIMNGATPVTSYVVAGQGTWSVASDVVSFVPLASFKGDPTPITYQITGTNGLTATATVTVTYVPAAVNDVRTGLTIGSTTTVPVLGNDNGDWNTATLTLMNGATAVSTLPVAGQGTWTVSGTDIVFTPAPGYKGDPTPVTYRITDTTGDQVTATVTLGYVPTATNDSSLGNALGTTVNQSVLTNDNGDWNTATLKFTSNNATTLVVAGQGTWSVQSGGVIRFVPQSGYKGDPTPVGYSITDTTGDVATATVTVGYVPSATNDSNLGNALGTVVSVPVLNNDDGDWAAGTLTLMNGATPVSTIVVAGQGTWSVSGTNVVFTPVSGFLGDPSPVQYRVTDTTGDPATATVTVTYVPKAVNDFRGNLTIGTATTVPVLANDSGLWDTSTLKFSNNATTLTVAGEGVWTIVGTDVIFTPQSGFLLDPAPVTYKVTDTTGDTVTATVTLDYGPAAVDDSNLGNALGTVVSLNVLTNDTGSFDTSTLRFAANGGTTYTVAGQGTWSIPSSGVVRFTPLASFLGDPTPVTYTVKDVNGDSASAKVTITYVPNTTHDSSLNNAFGTNVNVNVLANDHGDWAASSVRIMNGATPVTSLHVAGQGTWVVEADDTVTFVPDAGFLTDPADVTYRVTDTTGDMVTATIHVTYLPEANDDAQGGLAIGAVATVPVLANDHGDWVTSSLKFAANNGTSLTVAGEGVWTVSGTNVVFTPQSGFLVDPSPVTYAITDSTGDTVTATVTLDYGPGAADDADLGNTIGDVVDVHVFDNDSGSFDDSTLQLQGGVSTLVVPGQGTWSVRSGGVIRFTPLPGFLTDPTPVHYLAKDVTGDPVDAIVTITYVPAAADDAKLGNAFGTDVTVTVLANDTGDFTAGTVRLLDGTTPTTHLVVAGEGAWTVNADDTVTFQPAIGFAVDPSPVRYQVTDSTGDMVSAKITVTYLPMAHDDSRGNLTIGAAVTIPVLSNDDGSFDTGSVRLIDPVSHTVAAGSVTVAGQGVWSLGAAGTIVFTPQSGFVTDPDPISYQVTDVTGDVTGATITLDYVPAAADDQKLDNAIGAVVNQSVLANDTGDFDASTLVFVANGGTTYSVAGQGTWTIPSSGVVRFTPQAGYKADPTPVTYRITDTTGDAVTATVTVTYIPAASDDSDLGNVLHTDVNVDVLGNDDGDFVAGSVRILDGSTPVTSLVVAGQGTWTVLADDTITFHPLSSFLTDPTPIHYRVTDVTGDVASAKVTITYLPVAVDDAQGNLAIGSHATVAVLGNDSGDWVTSSLKFASNNGTSLTVAGEGVWTVSGTNVVFAPAAGFLVDPTPVTYKITDSTGDTVTAEVTLDYVPDAVDDESLGNAIGTVIDLSVIANDDGDFDLTTLGFGPGNVGVGATLVVAGEGTWEVRAGGVIRFTPVAAFVGDPTKQHYYVDDVTGDSTSAWMTITYIPAAADDSDLGNAIGDPVNVDVLSNDTGAFTPGTVRILNGATPVSSLVVAGQGTWSVQADDSITFTPASGFLVDPTPIHYQVTDTTGDVASAKVTVTYLPVAADDAKLGNVLGSTVNVAVLGNDTGSFTLNSVRILDGATPVLTLTVAGEGEWRANSDGTVTFVPEAGFLVDPTPVHYQVTDVTGDVVSAKVTITYLPTVASDVKSGSAIGSPTVVNVLTNDTGDFDPTTLRIIDPGSGSPVTTLVVAGEGTWTVDTTGHITFTPDPGYMGNPTPVSYQITDVTGDTVSATATVTYLPTAKDDKSLGNPQGKKVTVPILTNDQGVFDVSTARLLSHGTPVMDLVVPGEGTWHMNATTGEVSFTPQAGFTGNPTPIPYRVLDTNGNSVTANVTITYVHANAVILALTGSSLQTPLMIALAAIILGLGAMIVARGRKITARHRM